MPNIYPLSASLTFRGFSVDPATVQEWIGVAASELGTKGAPVKSGAKTPLIRQFARFSLKFDSEENVFKMIPALLSHMKGLENICSVQQRLAAEYIDVNLVLPFKRANRATNGWINQESIYALHKIGATLAFEIL